MIEVTRHAGEEDFRSLAENASDLIGRVSPQGTWAYVSPSVGRLGGYVPAQFLGTDIADLCHPEDVEALRAALALAAQGEAVARVVHRWRTAEGRYLWLETLARLPQGGREIHVASRDVTERMDAQRALAESEERFRVFSMRAPIGAFMVDPNGDVVVANERMCGIVGRKLDQIRGRRWIEHVHPEDRERAYAGWQEAVTASGDWASELRVVRPDEGVRWVEASGRCLTEPAGEAAGFLVAYTDVTMRKQAEAALRAAAADQAARDTEERAMEGLRALLEPAPGMVWILRGPQHVVLLANEEARRGLGRPSDIVGRLLREAVPHLEDEGILDALDGVFATGTSVDGMAHLGDRANGALYRFTAHATRDAHQEIDGVIVHAVDVTDETRAREAAQAAAARLDAVAGGLRAIVWEADLSRLRFGFVGEASQPLLGYAPDLWLEPGFWERLIHPDDRERVVRSANVAAAEGRDHRLEYRALAADGTVVWVRDRARVLRDAAGRPTGLTGVIVDIGEERRAEAERGRAEALARRLAGVDGLTAALVGAGGVARVAEVVASQLAGALGASSVSVVLDRDGRQQVLATSGRADERGRRPLEHPLANLGRIAVTFDRAEEPGEDERQCLASLASISGQAIAAALAREEVERERRGATSAAEQARQERVAAATTAALALAEAQRERDEAWRAADEARRARDEAASAAAEANRAHQEAADANAQAQRGHEESNRVAAEARQELEHQRWAASSAAEEARRERDEAAAAAARSLAEAERAREEQVASAGRALAAAERQRDEAHGAAAEAQRERDEAQRRHDEAAAAAALAVVEVERELERERQAASAATEIAARRQEEAQAATAAATQAQRERNEAKRLHAEAVASHAEVQRARAQAEGAATEAERRREQERQAAAAALAEAQRAGEEAKRAAADTQAQLERERQAAEQLARTRRDETQAAQAALTEARKEREAALQEVDRLDRAHREASERLGGLAYAATAGTHILSAADPLSGLVAFLVPELCAGAAVDVLEEGEATLRRVAEAVDEGQGGAALAAPWPEGPDDPAWRVILSRRARALDQRDEAVSRALVPLRAGRHTIGVLRLARTDGRAFGEEELAFMEGVARTAAAASRASRLEQAAALSQARADGARRRGERIQAIAETLSTSRTRGEVCEAASVTARAVLGAASGSLALLDDDRRRLDTATSWGSPAQQGSVLSWEDSLRRRVPVFHSSLDREAWATAPLVGRGGDLGVLQLGFRGPYEFDDDERDVVATFAQQLANALERTRSQGAASGASAVLHQALLRPRTGDVRGVKTSARYRAGGPSAGEWHDVMELPGERLGVALGEVAERGARAIAVAAQLRAGLRAIALEETDPAWALERLGRFAQGVPGARMATVGFAVLEPSSGRLRYASAGHPPPLLIDENGTVSYLTDEESLPLATGDGPSAGGRAGLLPGSTLCLYSRSVVESGGRSVDAGLEALAEAAPAWSALAVDEVTERLIEWSGPSTPEGDLAALALRLTASADEPLRLSLVARADELPYLRRRVTEWTEAAGASLDEVYELTLACSEAVANAIVHAYPEGEPGPVEVRLRHLGEGHLELSVRDSGRWAQPQGESVEGRGLELIRSVMDAVEVAGGEAGTLVTMRRKVGGAPRG